MELSARLARFAFACPRPLVVVAPGATAERLAVERALRRRGGTAAAGAADADTLVVCGARSAALEDVLERVWDQLPAPRARVDVLAPERADAALDEAAARLRDVGAQRRAAAGHTAARGVRERLAGGGDDMEAPGGLPMAGQAPDRDGLRLDRLHLRLGPALADWPAGLALDLALQGDVVQEAAVHHVPHAPGAPHGDGAFWTRGGPARTAAAHLDSAGRLLAVAGWADGAAQARRLRDALLDGEADGRVVARFARQVRRARLLRRSLAGIGTLDRETARRHGVGGPAVRAGGDVLDRLNQWLTEATGGAAGWALAAGEGPRGPRAGRPASAALLEVLPDLLVGLDLASARLVVASLDPDLDELVPAGAEVAGAR